MENEAYYGTEECESCHASKGCPVHFADASHGGTSVYGSDDAENGDEGIGEEENLQPQFFFRDEPFDSPCEQGNGNKHDGCQSVCNGAELHACQPEHTLGFDVEEDWEDEQSWKPAQQLVNEQCASSHLARVHQVDSHEAICHLNHHSRVEHQLRIVEPVLYL